MIVGVNLLWCLPGEVGGSEEYLARQLVGVHRAAPDVTTRLVVLPGYSAAHRDVFEPTEPGQVEVVVASLDARRRSRRLLTEATWLPQQLGGVDVVHHGGGTVPPRSPRPIVLTVHDVQYRTYPQYFSRLKRAYLAVVVPRSIRRAAVVAVPSEYVRTTLIDAFGTDPDKVVVVAHGVAPAHRSGDDDDVRRRYGLGEDPFVVFPAITHPHKNHRLLVDLLAGPWRDRDLRLVLLGGAGAAEDAVAAAIASSGVAERIVRPGRVPDADRDALVAAADALVFPSEYEGFGAPVLEAMMLGTPVLTGDRAALPEVVGNAAVMRPLTLEAWADGLDEVDARRVELVAAGKRRAEHFSADASGHQLAAAYRRAGGSGG